MTRVLAIYSVKNCRVIDGHHIQSQAISACVISVLIEMVSALDVTCPTFAIMRIWSKSQFTPHSNTHRMLHISVRQPDNALTDWLRKREIPSIPCRTPLFGRLREISQRNKTRTFWQSARGLFCALSCQRFPMSWGWMIKYVLLHGL